MDPFESVDIDIRRDKVSFDFETRSYEARPDLSEEALRQLDGLRGDGTPEDYGDTLYNRVFRERARAGLDDIRNATGGGRRIRIRLNIDTAAPEMHRLWWEALREPEPPYFNLACRDATPISRFLRRPFARPAVKADDLRVLVVVGNPNGLGEGPWADYPALEGDSWRERINDLLEPIDRIEPIIADRSDTGHISDLLAHHQCHILHIVAHGGVSAEGTGFVLLEDRNDATVNVVPETALASVVRDVSDLQLVVLLTCQGATRSATDAFMGMAPRMLEYSAPAVVAMQDVIEPEQADRFTERFYTALGDTTRSLGYVDAAVNDARRSMFADDMRGWAWSLPVLFMQGEGRLFAPPDPGGAPIRSTENVVRFRQRVEAAAPATRPVAATTIEQRTRLPDGQDDGVAGPPAWQLLQDLKRRASLAKFVELCIYLEIEYDDLKGDDLQGKQAFMVTIFRRDQTLDRLQTAMEIVLGAAADVIDIRRAAPSGGV